MTRLELLERLQDLRGATFATLVVNVEPSIKCPKTSGMGGRIRKRSKVNVTLGFIYANSVNRQREREGNESDFQVNPRKWGERVKGTTLVVHKGQYYLEIQEEKVYETEYYLDGNLVEKEIVKQYLKEPAPQPQQELEREVILRDYRLDSIESVTINHETMKVEND